ncbi:MAG: hypothetical protein GEV06_07760 [Luteitalea sp.]|nr:hypothetical protein [Luteitalea sp.]
MAEEVRLVDYFYVFVPDKPGAGSRILQQLKDANVNLLAFSGFPEGRRAQLDFVPEDPAALKRLARRAKWKLVGPKKAFLIADEDRVGAMADLLGRLADAGINVIASDAVATRAGQFGVILWVAPRDVRKAAKVLGAK